VPPGHEPEPPLPSPHKWHIAVDARLAVPLGARPAGLPPVGWGAGVAMSRALVDLGRLRFGLGVDFAYQRVQHDKHSEVTLGDVQQFTSHMTFAGLLVFDGIFGRLRPWLALGGGLSVARYDDPPTTGKQVEISAGDEVPLVQLAAGLGIEITHGIDLGLGGQLDLTFSSRQAETPPVQLFAPGLFSLRADVGFRF
jgi:hypothetical protein